MQLMRKFLIGAALLTAILPNALLAAEEAGSSQPVATASPEFTQPLAEVVIPPGRPAWVESSPIRNSKVDQTAVKSEPFVRRADCERALQQELTEAVNEYIVEQTGSKLAPTLISYDVNTIKKRFVAGNHRYDETIISPSVGEMHQIHALLEFDENFRNEIAKRWLQIRSVSRLGQVGLGFATILGVISTIFGFFRADNATRGYYTGRLQFVAVVAILAMVIGVVTATRWLPFL